MMYIRKRDVYETAYTVKLQISQAIHPAIELILKKIQNELYGWQLQADRTEKDSWIGVDTSS